MIIPAAWAKVRRRWRRGGGWGAALLTDGGVVVMKGRLEKGEEDLRTDLVTG